MNELPTIDPEAPAFIRVKVKSIPVVIEALRAAGQADVAKSVEEFGRAYTDPHANAERLEWLERANKVQQYGKIEFDSDATISQSEDNGEYVLGWVWIDAPDEDGENECQNCGKFWDDDELKPVTDLLQRVGPGEEMPSGECPDCGAVCHPVDENEDE